MKYEVASNNTKKALAESLKKAMQTKPLAKITVSELISDCGVNRKTFYYHFEDIYDLLKWVLEQEAVTIVKSFDLLVNAEEALEFVIDYVDANKHIINCAYDCMGREKMRQFLYADGTSMIRSIVDSIAEELGVTVTDSFKDFVTDFYVETLAGMLINYFQGILRYSRQELIDNTLFILQHSIPSILRQKAAEGTPGQ